MEEIRLIETQKCPKCGYYKTWTKRKFPSLFKKEMGCGRCSWKIDIDMIDICEECRQNFNSKQGKHKKCKNCNHIN